MERHEKVHSFYIVVGLLVLIIATATVRFGDKTDLIQYINFAASISSLILAVLAIIYAFLSNDGVSSSLKRVEDASRHLEHNADKVTSSASQVVESGNRIEQATAGIVAEMGTISATLTGVRKEIGVIPDAIVQVKEKVFSTHDMMAKLNQPVKQQESGTATPFKTEGLYTVEHYKYYLSRCSIVGLRLLYSLYMAAKANKVFAFKQIHPLLKTAASYDYHHGFFVATIASNAFRAGKAKNDIYSITLNPEFAAALEASLNKIIEDDGKSSLNAGDRSWNAVFEQVQEFLTSQPSLEETDKKGA